MHEMHCDMLNVHAEYKSQIANITKLNKIMFYCTYQFMILPKRSPKDVFLISSLVQWHTLLVLYISFSEDFTLYILQVLLQVNRLCNTCQFGLIYPRCFLGNAVSGRMMTQVSRKCLLINSHHKQQHDKDRRLAQRKIVDVISVMMLLHSLSDFKLVKFNKQLLKKKRQELGVIIPSFNECVWILPFLALQISMGTAGFAAQIRREHLI